MSAMPIIALAWPKEDYVSALRQAGAEPRVIDPAQVTPASVLDSCDGILLTGGADVDPVHYGDAERHPSVSLEPSRDVFELELARLAMARNMPILAICRGVQLLNVAAGGTLVQDLPTHVPSSLNHSIKEPAHEPVHTVTVEAESHLSRVLDVPPDAPVSVNSRHHQAVKAVAPGFRAVARAEDGVIEAIEKPDASFCIGVQWHPENFWRTGEFASLFAGLIDAARQRAGGSKISSEQR